MWHLKILSNLNQSASSLHIAQLSFKLKNSVLHLNRNNYLAYIQELRGCDNSWLARRCSSGTGSVVSRSSRYHISAPLKSHCRSPVCQEGEQGARGEDESGEEKKLVRLLVESSRPCNDEDYYASHGHSEEVEGGEDGLH